MKNLPEVIAQHRKWLNQKGGERAVLKKANLRKAYLTECGSTALYC